MLQKYEYRIMLLERITTFYVYKVRFYRVFREKYYCLDYYFRILYLVLLFF